ncbi:hypothetical protein AXG93_1543s1430 [Marchantia polymorpha subsp. ruderalis]|uniref:Uncharacterized protein n=1 Tax=Marchantia polymorpha subsp. ruderalis TaxID=1480154 RepID=A0A176W010_MARPO|nr:hypothetical protein AXG93_1543s1430 [Marchantia polymorpha subsp. ruderalis]
MDNGTAEMEPAKIAATKDVSTDVEDVSASNIKSEMVEPVDGSSANDRVDESETSGMEMGSFLSEDVISPEEAVPNVPEESVEKAEIDASDSENTPASEHTVDAVGEAVGGYSAEEGSGRAATSNVSTLDVGDSEQTEDENAPTDSDDAAILVGEEVDDSLQSDGADPTARPVPEIESPGGESTAEESRGDNLDEKSEVVTSENSSTIRGSTDAVDEDEVQKPDVGSEILTEPEDSGESQSVKDSETDLVPDVSQNDGGEEQGVLDSVETNTNVELGEEVSPSESGAQPDIKTVDTEAVENSSVTADSSEPAGETLPTVSFDDGILSTMNADERDCTNEALAENHAARPSGTEDSQYEAQEQADRVLSEEEDKSSNVCDGDEPVQAAPTNESTESGGVEDRTETTTSNPTELVEDFDAGDGLVDDLVPPAESLNDAEEIVEVVSDAPTPGLEASEGEIEAPDESMLSPSTSADSIEDSTTGDGGVGSTDGAQTTSHDSNEVVEGATELDAPASSTEAEEEQLAGPGSGEEQPDVVTEGGEFIDTSSHPNLDVEKIVEVMSKEQDAPAPRMEDVEEEHVVETGSELETPGREDPETMEMSSLAMREVSGNLETVEASDILDNTDASLVVDNDSNENAEEASDELDEPTSIVHSGEGEQEAEAVRDVESLDEINTDATSTEQDISVDSPDGLTEGGATEGAEKAEPSVSPDIPEELGQVEQETPALALATAEEKQIAGTDTGTPVDTDAAKPPETPPSVESPQSVEVSERGDELLNTADDTCGSTSDSEVVSKFISSDENRLASGLEAVEEKQAAGIEAEVDAPSETASDATRTGLLNSAKIHPEVLETDDASGLEEEAVASDKVQTKEVVVDEQDALKSPGHQSGFIIANDRDDELSSISSGTVEFGKPQEQQFTDEMEKLEEPSREDVSTSVSGRSGELEEESSVLSRQDTDVGDAVLSERDSSCGSGSGDYLETVGKAELAQGPSDLLQIEEGVVSISSDHELEKSTSVHDEQAPETAFTDMSLGAVVNEDLAGGSKSSAEADMLELKAVDNGHPGEAEEASVSETPKSNSELSLAADRAESPESEDLVSGDSLKGDSQKEIETGEAASGLEVSPQATPDVPRELEILKDIIFEHSSEVQDLIRHVSESENSLAMEDTPTEVKVPEASKSQARSLQTDTSLQASTDAEKVLFTTDDKKVIANAERQEDTSYKGDFLQHSILPTPSDSEGSEHAALRMSGPSAVPKTESLGGDVEQKEISGQEDTSVRNVVTTDHPMASLPTDTTPKDSQVPIDSKFQGMQSVYFPDKLQKELLSLNKANVAAKGKEDFLTEGEIHPMGSHHFLSASKGSTFDSSGDVATLHKSPETVDSSRKEISSEFPIISHGGKSFGAIETYPTVGNLKAQELGRLTAEKDEASVPLSTYSGDLSSSWIPAPEASASDVHSRSQDSKQNFTEKEVPRLRAVARGNEDRKTVPEREVSTTSTTPAKSSDPVPRPRAQITREDDLNDAKFPLSMMLWCSHSLSSLFGSAKSL